MIVVESSVITALFVSTPPASELAERALQRDPEWMAPYSWRIEVCNMLALHVRHRRLALPDAELILQKAQDLMRGKEFDVPAMTALSLAASSGLPAYNCEGIALALAHRVPYVTTDDRIVAAYPQSAVSLASFAPIAPSLTHGEG
jgi:predicted nucleic acid-binding protein